MLPSIVGPLGISALGGAAGAFDSGAGDSDEGGAAAGASSSLEQALPTRVSVAAMTG